MYSWLSTTAVLGLAVLLLAGSVGPVAAQTPEEAEAAFQKGITLGDDEKHVEAIAAYKKALEMYSLLRGEESLPVANCLNNLGIQYKILGQINQAEGFYQRCLKICEAQVGKDHLDTAMALNNLANLYEFRAQYAKAETLFQRCLEIRKAQLGENHIETRNARVNLADLYKRMGKYVTAEKLFQQNLAIYKALGNEEGSPVALANLATLYYDMFQFSRAEELFQRCLKIHENLIPKNPSHHALVLKSLAKNYHYQGKISQGMPLLLRSLEVLETHFGKEHPKTVEVLEKLALVKGHLGFYDQSEALYQRCLNIQETHFGKNHFKSAYFLRELGWLYLCQCQYDKATRFLHQALEIVETYCGKDSEKVTSPLLALGHLYDVLGQFDQAETYLQRYLAVAEAQRGKDHPFTDLTNLGLLYRSMGQYDRAETLLQQQLKKEEAQHFKDHDYIPLALNNLALVYIDMGKYARAEALLQRSLKIWENLYGKNDFRLARTQNILGILYVEMGQYARAEVLVQRFLESHKAFFGKELCLNESAYKCLAWLYAAQGQRKEALFYSDRDLRASAELCGRTLPFFSKPEQQAYLRRYFEKHFYPALSLRLFWAQDAALAEVSAAWPVNGKGLSFQTLAEQLRLASEAKDPKVRGLVDQLQQTRAILARLLQQLPQPGLEQANKEQCQQLYQQERNLAQQLARTVGRPFREDPWVEIHQVRGQLDPKAVLIDLARFPVWDFKNRRWQPARYLAWITPPAGKGSVQIIDLGEAEPIDQGVEAARKALSKSLEEIRRQGEAEAVKQLREPMQTLARKTLYPLLEQLKDYPKWIICPDGALWLVPWSALPLPDGQYVVEQHSIRHVVSGRDLVIEYPKTQTVTPWLFADPDFDLTPAQVGTAANGVFRNLGPPEGLRLAGRRLLGRIGNWRIAFAFQENGQVLICDEDDNGKVIGQGPWQLNGNTLTMTSENYHYLGTVQGALVSGQRTGTLGTDPWEIRLAGGDLEMVQLRSAGTASGILAKVNRLPFTAAEAEAVRPLVKAWTTMEPKVVMGEEAGEAVIKAVRRPRLLMLSTHGYFLPEQEVKLPDRLSGLVLDEQRPRVVLDVHGKPLENPLLRCGLLLAGCNQRQQVQGDEDDGILTGMEIVGLDLRGCELVVLSACETGLGDVRTGEGVAGLRQAFQLAGASAVVATLWSIPDRDSARLMSDFFGNLAKGQSKAAALREAQLARIKAHRERTGAAHPFFWAAFTLTGQ